MTGKEPEEAASRPSGHGLSAGADRGTRWFRLTGPLAGFLRTAMWVGGVVFARTVAAVFRPASALRRKGWWATCKNLVVSLRALGNAENAKVLRRYFDRAYYLEANPDVRSAGLNPLAHYLLQGYLEGRSPSPDFDAQFYTGRYRDVAESGINPLLHYAVFGRREGRYAVPYIAAAPGANRVGPLPGERAEPAPQTASEADGAMAAPCAINNQWLAERPLASVVITCFNYGRYLREALDSVLAQTFEDFEVIVVEGGSTDGSTRQQVRELESQAPPKVRFLYRDSRHLAGDNRNFGIAASRGRYICCLDADDLLRPVYLEAAVFLAETYGYDIVYPSVQCFGAADLVWRVVDASFSKILTENQIATVALFRKSCWAHVGGYRDWGLGGDYVPEDWDLWVRLLGHGAAPKSIRAALMLYRVHGTSLTVDCRYGTRDQLAQIRQANLELIEQPTPSPMRRCVLNPRINLCRPGAQETKPGILFALPFVTIGGAETLMSTLARGFAEDGWQAVVTTTIALPPSMREHFQVFEPVTSCIYDLPSLFMEPKHWKDFIWHLIQTKNIQIVLLAGSEFVYHLLPELHADFPHVRVLDQLFNDAVHVYNNRRYAQFIERTIVPSLEMAASLVDRHGADPASIRVIGHGIDFQRGLSCPPAERAAPPPAPKQEGQFIVSFFGRFSCEKAPLTFVKIADRLSADPSLRFYMTGEGPEREAVLGLIERRGLTGRIYAPGFVPDVRPLMEQSDVVVLPSTIDGMPLAVLEAQTLGKPVVASRIGSLPVMVLDRQTGFLCEPEDIDMFCQCIVRLRNDAGLRGKMGERARIHAAAAFGAERMLSEYRAVLGEPGGPPAVLRSPADVHTGRGVGAG